MGCVIHIEFAKALTLDQHGCTAKMRDFVDESSTARGPSGRDELNFRFTIADCRLPIADCRLPIVVHYKRAVRAGAGEKVWQGENLGGTGE
jgi:hypothetical protein